MNGSQQWVKAEGGWQFTMTYEGEPNQRQLEIEIPYWVLNDLNVNP